MKNYFLFYLILILLIILVREEFFSIWVWTEIVLFINILFFIKEKINLYFIAILIFIQSLSSLIIISFLLFSMKSFFSLKEMPLSLFFLGLTLKRRIFPFFWSVPLRSYINWLVVILLNSFPKIVSLVYFKFLFFFHMIGNLNLWLRVIILFNFIVIFFLFSEKRFIKILIVSRIFNLSLVFFFFIFEKNFSLIFFICYLLISILLIVFLMERNALTLMDLFKKKFNKDFLFIVFIIFLILGIPPIIIFLIKFIFFLKLIFSLNYLWFWSLYFPFDSLLTYFYVGISVSIISLIKEEYKDPFLTGEKKIKLDLIFISIIFINLLPFILY